MPYPSSLQIYVNQMTEDVVSDTRHCADNHVTIVFVAHCAVAAVNHGNNDQRELPHIAVEGILALFGNFFLRHNILEIHF